jgi:carboxyl-terminal processing protease
MTRVSLIILLLLASLSPICAGKRESLISGIVTDQKEPVVWRLESEIAYIWIKTFNARSATAFENAVMQVKNESGERLKGFILDLRNNGGGLLDQSVTVADAFLDGGTIVVTRGRTGVDETRFAAKPGQISDKKPLIVLINAKTAGAAEVVAGALQDHGRAVLVGEGSAGSGSVQSVIDLGENGAVKLTTARIYTPLGRGLGATGLEPDYLVPLPRPQTGEAESPRDAKNSDDRSSQLPGLPDPSEDTQLRFALSHLRR